VGVCFLQALINPELQIENVLWNISDGMCIFIFGEIDGIPIKTFKISYLHIKTLRICSDLVQAYEKK
jgi:hypothetical protein